MTKAEKAKMEHDLCPWVEERKKNKLLLKKYKKKGGTAPIKLYSVFFVADGFEEQDAIFDGVQCECFVDKRENPLPIDYADYILDYRKNKNDDNPLLSLPEGCINECFTLEEAIQLKKWIKHIGGEKCKIKEVDIPIPPICSGLGGRVSGRGYGLYSLYRKEEYNLPFRAMFYYDLRRSGEAKESMDRSDIRWS